MITRLARAVLAVAVTTSVAAAGPPERARPIARSGPARLVDGGFQVLVPRDATVGTTRTGSEPAPLLARRLAAMGLVGHLPPRQPAPRPTTVGDRLIVSLDDDMDLPVNRGYEARLDVSGGVAGPTDAIAVRFPSQSLARLPPFRVRSLLLGVDDLNGATTFPSVELWLEDATTPLVPRAGSVSSIVTAFDAVAAGVGFAPPGSQRPTAFTRVTVPVAIDVPATWLSDGSFDDDFARPDGLLDDGLSDWLECQDGTCTAPLPGGSPLVRLTSGAAVRGATGFATLAVKFQASSVAATRPANDVDLRASVTIRDATAGFGRAGLALRALAADAYYRVEYVKTPPSVEIAAITPLGADVLATYPVGPSLGTRRLQVTVTGGAPSVDIAVTLDGTPFAVVSDATYRYVGGLVGLSASSAASSGEQWDDLVVERAPDVFAVVALPPGEDVGLPLDLSLDSLRSDSILLSSDGSSFTPRSVGGGCAQPGNPFVQLEVEDSVAGDRLFQREAHVVEVPVACPTCATGIQGCNTNHSFLEASPPTLTAGQALDVSVGWWNEHLADDNLIFRATAYTGPCDAPDLFVATGSVVVASDAGQLAGPAEMRRTPVFSFTPVDPGQYCIIVEELHDTNGDCCPDGAETSPLGGCGGACTPAAASDDNPATGVVLRDVLVASPCTPRGPDVGRDGPDDLNGDTVPDEINLDGGSLRVTHGAGDAVTLTWSVLDALVFPARYNLLLMEGQRLPAGDCFRVVAPVFDRPSATTTRSYDLAVQEGRPAWLAVYETNGCPGDASVQDSSADDVALRCP